MVNNTNHSNRIDWFQSNIRIITRKLRLSVDGTKTFIKYEINEILEDIVHTGINPETQEETSYTTLAGVYGRPNIYQEGDTEYNHEEILHILSTEEWTKPIEELR